jgi:hypothetical protein
MEGETFAFALGEHRGKIVTGTRLRANVSTSFHGGLVG